VHDGVISLRATDAGRAWLNSLPRLIAECAERWSLRVGAPFPYACASLALQVVLSNGLEAVLKIQFPDRESEHEAAALAHWGGDGAVRLLAHDSERQALLLERCRPGTPLSLVDPEAALDVMIRLLPRLWKPAGAPFRQLEAEALWWAGYLPERWEVAGKPFERSLLDAAIELLHDLRGTQGEQVLLHQDLHAANVLRAEREPWLVIDPKPLLGEREFGIAPLVRGGELGHGPKLVRRRLDRLASELDLDRERARGWALSQTIAWSIQEKEAIAEMVECARWLLED